MLFRVIPHAGRRLSTQVRSCTTTTGPKVPKPVSSSSGEQADAKSSKKGVKTDPPSAAKHKKKKKKVQTTDKFTNLSTENSTPAKLKAQETPSSTSTETAEWSGLSLARQRRMRIPPGAQSKNVGINAAIHSALTLPHNPAQFAFEIAKAADVALPLDTHATIINLAVHQSQIECPQSANSADIAVEAFLRLSATSRQRSTSSALAAVARFAIHDPIIERRADRAASILRFLINYRLNVTAEVLLAIFDVFVSALDFRSAFHVLTFAHEMHASLSPVEMCYWYDKMMYVGLLRCQVDIVDVLNRQKEALNLPVTVYGHSAQLALYAERGDFDDAKSLTIKLEHDEIAIENFAFASLIRAASKENDVNAVNTFYAAFEKSLQGCAKKFLKSLSLLSMQVQVNLGSVNLGSTFSQRASDASREDPTLAMFQALRVCGEAEEALALIRRLRSQYGVSFSTLLHTVVTETCFKARRTDLAIEFRDEIKESSKQTKVARRVKNRK